MRIKVILMIYIYVSIKMTILNISLDLLNCSDDIVQGYHSQY